MGADVKNDGQGLGACDTGIDLFQEYQDAELQAQVESFLADQNIDANLFYSQNDSDLEWAADGFLTEDEVFDFGLERTLDQYDLYTDFENSRFRLIFSRSADSKVVEAHELPDFYQPADKGTIDTVEAEENVPEHKAEWVPHNFSRTTTHFGINQTVDEFVENYKEVLSTRGYPLPDDEEIYTLAYALDELDGDMTTTTSTADGLIGDYNHGNIGMAAYLMGGVMAGYTIEETLAFATKTGEFGPAEAAQFQEIAQAGGYALALMKEEGLIQVEIPLTRDPAWRYSVFGILGNELMAGNTGYNATTSSEAYTALTQLMSFADASGIPFYQAYNAFMDYAEHIRLQLVARQKALAEEWAGVPDEGGYALQLEDAQIKIDGKNTNIDGLVTAIGHKDWNEIDQALSELPVVEIVGNGAMIQSVNLDPPSWEGPRPYMIVRSKGHAFKVNGQIFEEPGVYIFRSGTPYVVFPYKGRRHTFQDGEQSATWKTAARLELFNPAELTAKADECRYNGDWAGYQENMMALAQEFRDFSAYQTAHAVYEELIRLGNPEAKIAQDNLTGAGFGLSDQTKDFLTKEAAIGVAMMVGAGEIGLITQFIGRAGLVYLAERITVNTTSRYVLAKFLTSRWTHRALGSLILAYSIEGTMAGAHYYQTGDTGFDSFGEFAIQGGVLAAKMGLAGAAGKGITGALTNRGVNTLAAGGVGLVGEAAVFTAADIGASYVPVLSKDGPIPLGQWDDTFVHCTVFILELRAAKFMMNAATGGAYESSIKDMERRMEQKRHDAQDQLRFVDSWKFHKKFVDEMDNLGSAVNPETGQETPIIVIPESQWKAFQATTRTMEPSEYNTVLGHDNGENYVLTGIPCSGQRYLFVREGSKLLGLFQPQTQAAGAHTSTGPVQARAAALEGPVAAAQPKQLGYNPEAWIPGDPANDLPIEGTRVEPDFNPDVIPFDPARRHQGPRVTEPGEPEIIEFPEVPTPSRRVRVMSQVGPILGHLPEASRVHDLPERPVVVGVRSDEMHALDELFDAPEDNNAIILHQNRIEGEPGETFFQANIDGEEVIFIPDHTRTYQHFRTTGHFPTVEEIRIPTTLGPITNEDDDEETDTVVIPLDRTHSQHQPNVFTVEWAPSGLQVVVGEQSDVVAVAREVLESYAPDEIPNRRIVLDTQQWDEPLRVTNGLRQALRELAEESNITIALRTSDPENLVTEFEPSEAVEAQRVRGPLAAAANPPTTTSLTVAQRILEPTLPDRNLPEVYQIDTNQFTQRLGGNQNRGVFRIRIEGVDQSFIIKLNQRHRTMKEAAFFAWMDEKNIGPKYYGVYEVNVDGQTLYGVVLEDCGPNAIKISTPIPSYMSREIRERWNINSQTDWSRVREAFTESDIQPRDFEVLLKPDGHIVVIDPGMFVNHEEINIAPNVRLQGLASFENGIRSFGLEPTLPTGDTVQRDLTIKSLDEKNPNPPGTQRQGPVLIDNGKSGDMDYRISREAQAARSLGDNLNTIRSFNRFTLRLETDGSITANCFSTRPEMYVREGTLFVERQSDGTYTAHVFREGAWQIIGEDANWEAAVNAQLRTGTTPTATSSDGKPIGVNSLVYSFNNDQNYLVREITPDGQIRAQRCENDGTPIAGNVETLRPEQVLFIRPVSRPVEPAEPQLLEAKDRGSETSGPVERSQLGVETSDKREDNLDELELDVEDPVVDIRGQTITVGQWVRAPDGRDYDVLGVDPERQRVLVGDPSSRNPSGIFSPSELEVLEVEEVTESSGRDIAEGGAGGGEETTSDFTTFPRMFTHAEVTGVPSATDPRLGLQLHPDTTPAEPGTERLAAQQRVLHPEELDIYTNEDDRVVCGFLEGRWVDATNDPLEPGRYSLYNEQGRYIGSFLFNGDRFVQQESADEIQPLPSSYSELGPDSEPTEKVGGRPESTQPMPSRSTPPPIDPSLGTDFKAIHLDYANAYREGNGTIPVDRANELLTRLQTLEARLPEEESATTLRDRIARLREGIEESMENNIVLEDDTSDPSYRPDEESETTGDTLIHGIKMFEVLSYRSDEEPENTEDTLVHGIKMFEVSSYRSDEEVTEDLDDLGRFLEEDEPEPEITESMPRVDSRAPAKPPEVQKVFDDLQAVTMALDEARGEDKTITQAQADILLNQWAAINGQALPIQFKAEFAQKSNALRIAITEATDVDLGNDLEEIPETPKRWSQPHQRTRLEEPPEENLAPAVLIETPLQSVNSRIRNIGVEITQLVEDHGALLPEEAQRIGDAIDTLGVQLNALGAYLPEDLYLPAAQELEKVRRQFFEALPANYYAAPVDDELTDLEDRFEELRKGDGRLTRAEANTLLANLADLEARLPQNAGGMALLPRIGALRDNIEPFTRLWRPVSQRPRPRPVDEDLASPIPLELPVPVTAQIENLHTRIQTAGSMNRATYDGFVAEINALETEARLVPENDELLASIVALRNEAQARFHFGGHVDGFVHMEEENAARVARREAERAALTPPLEPTPDAPARVAPPVVIRERIVTPTQLPPEGYIRGLGFSPLSAAQQDSTATGVLPIQAGPLPQLLDDWDGTTDPDLLLDEEVTPVGDDHDLVEVPDAAEDTWPGDGEDEPVRRPEPPPPLDIGPTVVPSTPQNLWDTQYRVLEERVNAVSADTSDPTLIDDISALQSSAERLPLLPDEPNPRIAQATTLRERAEARLAEGEIELPEAETVTPVDEPLMLSADIVTRADGREIIVFPDHAAAEYLGTTARVGNDENFLVYKDGRVVGCVENGRPIAFRHQRTPDGPLADGATVYGEISSVYEVREGGHVFYSGGEALTENRGFYAESNGNGQPVGALVDGVLYERDLVRSDPTARQQFKLHTQLMPRAAEEQVETPPKPEVVHEEDLRAKPDLDAYASRGLETTSLDSAQTDILEPSPPPAPHLSDGAKQSVNEMLGLQNGDIRTTTVTGDTLTTLSTTSQSLDDNGMMVGRGVTRMAVEAELLLGTESTFYGRHRNISPAATQFLDVGERTPQTIFAQTMGDLGIHFDGYWYRGGNMAFDFGNGKVVWVMRTPEGEQRFVNRGPTGRFYVDVRGTCAAAYAEGMNKIALEAQARNIPLQWKIPGDLNEFGRTDSGVIYFEAKDSKWVYDKVTALLTANPTWTRTGKPPFTMRVITNDGVIVQGLSFAMSTGGHSSFGSTMAYAMERACEELRTRINKGDVLTMEDVYDTVARFLVEFNIDPEYPAFLIESDDGTGREVFGFMANHTTFDASDSRHPTYPTASGESGLEMPQVIPMSTPPVKPTPQQPPQGQQPSPPAPVPVRTPPVSTPPPAQKPPASGASRRPPGGLLARVAHWVIAQHLGLTGSNRTPPATPIDPPIPAPPQVVSPQAAPRGPSSHMDYLDHQGQQLIHGVEVRPGDHYPSHPKTRRIDAYNEQMVRAVNRVASSIAPNQMAQNVLQDILNNHATAEAFPNPVDAAIYTQLILQELIARNYIGIQEARLEFGTVQGQPRVWVRVTAGVQGSGRRTLIADLTERTIIRSTNGYSAASESATILRP